VLGLGVRGEEGYCAWYIGGHYVVVIAAVSISVLCIV
jgi:hypothetical protein